MRSETYVLNVPASGTGTPFPCANLIDKWVQVQGIAGGANLVVEGTFNGSAYIAATGGTLTADGEVNIKEAFVSMRINRTVVGTGSPTATLVGRNTRTA